MSLENISDRTAAYLAGFFDGGGSVYAASRGGRGRSSDRRPSPTITVCTTSVNLTLIEFHRHLFGGSVSERVKCAGHRPQYQWVLCARQAAAFLKVIRPYLIAKAEVVDVALEFIALQALPAGERRDYSQRVMREGISRCSPRIRPEFQEKQFAVWLRIRELNARGAPMNALRRRSALEEDILDKRRTDAI